MFDGCKVLQKGSQTDLQVLINYLTDTLGGAVPEAYKDPYGQGRIIEVAGNAEETER